MGSRGNFDHHGFRWALDEGGYQFAVTGLPYRVVLPGSLNLTLADGVYVPWPNPRSNQRWEDVKPVPTGAMLREDTSDPANPRWPFFQVYTAENYTVAANLFWKYNIGLQVDGAPATETYRYKRDTSNPVPNQYKPSRPIYTSIASNEGQIRMAGAFMPAYGFVNGDVKYDRAPQADEMKTQLGSITLNEKPWSRKQAKYQAPDADWYHDATIIQVNRPDNLGTIPFVIMVDASSTFHAWPVGTTPQSGLADGAYADQSIKTNIPSDRAKTCKPPFPGWVYDTTDFSYRDFYASEGHQPFWPRYVWRFHPFENKVVGMCLHREKPNYEVLKKTADSGFRLKDVYERDASMSPAGLYWKRKLGDLYQGNTELREFEEDTPGWAEFGFAINITSEVIPGQPFNVNTCEFEFTMSLIRDDEAAETNYPIAASYLNPVKGDWSERGVNASPGALLVAKLRVFEHPKYLKGDLTAVLQGQPSFIHNQVSRVYLDIVNQDSSAILKTIPLLINNDCYGRSVVDHEGSEESAKTHFAIFGKIMQLKLEEFSWLVRYESTEIKAIEDTLFNVPPMTLGEEASVGVIYSNGPEFDPNNPVSYPLDDDGLIFGAESEIASRFVHRNQTKFEDSYGVNLNTLSIVDSVEPYGDSLLLEKQRLLLYEAKGLDGSNTNKLCFLLLVAFYNSEYLIKSGADGQPPDPQPSAAAIIAKMESLGYTNNILEHFPDFDDYDKVIDFFLEAESVANPGEISAATYCLLDRKLCYKIIPNDYFRLLPGYIDPIAYGKKNRINGFNDGKNTMMRVWNNVIHESFRQYFHTGPDGFYALSLTVPHINSTKPATDPITGEVIGLPEPTKPFPVGVGFHRWGWAIKKTRSVDVILTMNDYSVLYEFVSEIKKVEPDFDRPFTPMTERVLTTAIIDQIGFENAALPVTSHLQLYKRAYQLDDAQLDIPKYQVEPRLKVRFYALDNALNPHPILGIDFELYTQDKTQGGGSLPIRYRNSVPLGCSTIPGLMLYEGNATEIDTPRFNAGMHGVGFYLTGWHEYPA